MTEILKDGEPLDIFSGTQIEKTRANLPIGNISERRYDYTTSFELPIGKKSPRNSKLLGLPNIVAGLSETPYVAIRGIDLLENGFPILSGGVLNILRLENGNAKCVITSNSASLAETWKSLKLRDLRFPEFDHPRSNTIAAYTNNQYTDGFIYPLIDYNSDGSGTVWVYPAMFVLAVVKKCYSQFGYSVSGNIFDDNFAQNCIVPFSSGVLSYGKRFEEQFGESWNFSINSGFSDTFTADPTYDLDFFAFHILGSFTVTNAFSGVFGFLTGQLFTGIGYNIQIYDPVAMTYVTGETAFSAGQTLEVHLTTSVTIRAGSGSFTFSAYVDTVSVFTEFLENEINFGDVVHCEQVLPDMLISDFMKSFFQMFGLQHDIDEVMKSARIYGWTDIYASANQDLTQNVTGTDAPEEINFLPTEYGQRTIFTHDGGGSGSFVVGNELLEAEKTLITTKFKYSAQNPLGIAIIPMHTGSDVTDAGARVLFIRRTVQSIPPFGTLNFATGYFDYSEFGQHLGFSSLIENYYSEFVSGIMQRYKRLKLLAFMPPQKFRDLDFSRSAYLEQYGERFFIEKAEGYTDESGLFYLFLARM